MSTPLQRHNDALLNAMDEAAAQRLLECVEVLNELEDKYSKQAERIPDGSNGHESADNRAIALREAINELFKRFPL